MIEQLFDKAPCGFFCFSDEGNLLQVNDTLASLLNHDQQELRGKNVETLFTLPTRIFFQTHLYPLVKMQGHAEEIFISLLTSTGQHLPVLLNAKRMALGESTVTSCVFIVVPNRKKFEDELVAARKAAEKALSENTELLKIKADLLSHTENLERQMQMVSRQNHELKQFSHVVTHNLKEPLRKILIYSGRVKNNSDEAAMDKLIKAANQMNAVVSGLQQYVWLNEKKNKFKAVDLQQMIEATTLQLQQEQDTEVFNLQIGAIPEVDGDEEQLQLLIYQLLSNAIRFRKTEKADIRIEATVLKQNKFRTLSNQYQYIDFLRLEVYDNGIGFDPTYREHIFELFRRLHYSDGQGIGLALCKKVVDNHGGWIEADSKVDEFTKITVWLPARQIAMLNDDAGAVN